VIENTHSKSEAHRCLNLIENKILGEGDGHPRRSSTRKFIIRLDER